MPRTAFERLLRHTTPIHFYLCRACEHRGLTFGPVRVSGARPAQLPGRPIEARDRALARVKLRRTVMSFVFAALLGASVGLYVHGCRKDADVQVPIDP